MKAKKKKTAKHSAKNKKSLTKKVTKSLAKKKVVAVKKKSIKKATAPKAKSQKKVSSSQKPMTKKLTPKPRVKRKAQLVFRTESIKPIKPKTIVKLETEEVISELPIIEEEIVVEDLGELEDDNIDEGIEDNVKDVEPPLPLK